MNARCKFQITNILPAYPSVDPVTDTSKRIVMETRYDNTIDEDKAFTRYTSTGRMDVIIDNPAVTDKMNVGDSYYLDLTKI
jgi:hypothetical protein